MAMGVALVLLGAAALLTAAVVWGVLTLSRRLPPVGGEAAAPAPYGVRLAHAAEPATALTDLRVGGAAASGPYVNGTAAANGVAHSDAEGLAASPATAVAEPVPSGPGRRFGRFTHGHGTPGDVGDEPHGPGDLSRREARLIASEDRLDLRAEELERREGRLADRETAVETLRAEHVRALESVSGLPAGRAKALLLRELEDSLRHDRARLMRQIESETKRDADRRVRNILSVVMQRIAAGHAADTTVSVVQLTGDDMKGRIIGREGRNIRALEHLTGVDFIIDDTPNAVILSAFDGVRREVARLTLVKLLDDGRIHPAKIEETYYQARSELDTVMVKAGEDAALEAGVTGLDPELTRILGRLRFRTSYGQNVLAHSVECAQLAALMADELGASAKTARRAALLHDIGKALSHEVQGPHALIGGDLARKHGESEAVAHAMEAHHNEVEPQTVEAVIVQTADALSGARPGARGESLESYVKRLRELESLAANHAGVDRVFAMQAGREIRVMVEPGALDDDGMTLLSHELAREIERELEYPGQIKVTVIRESRATDYAR